MNLVDQVANAVLYEGYILYPYRPSVKNRQRWTFGGLFPKDSDFAEDGTEPCSMQSECLVRGKTDTVVGVTVRFLHLSARQVGELTQPVTALPSESELDFRPVENLQVGERVYQTWQEACERTASAGQICLADLIAHPRRLPFSFASSRELEPVHDSSQKIVGIVVRKQQALEGSIELAASRAGAGLFKLTVRVLNETPGQDASGPSRDEALMRCLVSTHAVLEVSEGEFVSLTDPDADARTAAATCRNVGCWPVLVGAEGERRTMLASPIILYDYPQIAPESPGDLFDATEIDEILSLRIMTLTEEEKRQAAAVDPRARELLARTEALAREQLMNLHGAVRGLRSVTESKT